MWSILQNHEKQQSTYSQWNPINTKRTDYYTTTKTGGKVSTWTVAYELYCKSWVIIQVNFTCISQTRFPMYLLNHLRFIDDLVTFWQKPQNASKTHFRHDASVKPCPKQLTMIQHVFSPQLSKLASTECHPTSAAVETSQRMPNMKKEMLLLHHPSSSTPAGLWDWKLVLHTDRTDMIAVSAFSSQKAHSGSSQSEIVLYSLLLSNTCPICTPLILFFISLSGLETLSASNHSIF